jgi:thiamine-phosphate pyrophosphorylase
MNVMKNQFYKLCLVTNKGNNHEDQYLNFIKICAKSGISSVQLREKNTPYESLLKFGKMLKETLAPFNIPLIINDNLDLALELDADGVHLGQEDGNIAAARNILGPDKIIGISINSLDQLYAANLLPVNYVGCGAIFPTKNKIDVSTIWGIEGLKQLSTLSKHPVVAIGGIDESNASEVISAGANGIAAIGVFHDVLDPESTTKNLYNIINMGEK